MEVDELPATERVTQGFGSTDPIPTRAFKTESLVLTIFFLESDAGNNEYVDAIDETHHTQLKEEMILMSHTII